MTYTGTIAWFRENKGYGFIHPDDGTEDIYMHAAELVEGDEAGLVEGAKVSYQAASGVKGRKAVSVRLVSAPASVVPASEEAVQGYQAASPGDWSWQDEIRAVVSRHAEAMTEEVNQLIAGWSQS